MPAARATTSSDERVSRQNEKMPPSSTANGRICISIQGMRKTSISRITPKPVAGMAADSRSSSRKSNSATSAVSAANISATATANCRPK